MTTVPVDPRNWGEKPPRYPITDDHPQHLRPDPQKPFVFKDRWGEWWAQVQNMDETFEGYLCRSGRSWEDALSKVPELMGAFWKRKATLCNERLMDGGE